MELLINPASYKNAIKLIALKVHQIFIGTNEFSTRNACILSIKEIEQLCKNKKQTKILILINKVFFETDIPKLEKYLLTITKLNIDGVIYADFAVNQILFEHKIKIYQIYNPETLVVNYGQLPFYKDNHINEVSLARELSGFNIVEILKHKSEMHIQLQVSGYSYMMWSRWQLLSNFKQSHNIKDNLVNKKMFLTEPKRDNKFIIYENNNGTNIMTDYNLCLLDKLQNLYDNKLDTIRIDSFLHNEKWINDNAEIYLKAIELLKTNKYDTSFIDYAKKRLIKYDKIQSNGFFDMDKKDLIYLSKIEE